jgi:hypothetical protein
MTLEPTRTHRYIQADFLTTSFRVVGKMLVSSPGVTGVMNDTTSAFMEIQDARLARLHMPTKLVDHFEVIRLVKSQVFAVCVPRREDLGPQAVARGGFARVVEYPIRVTTQVYELEGTLEFPGRFEFSSIMSEGTNDFLPLYNAKLTAVLIPSLRVESPAMMFNRRQVDMLGLIKERVDGK